MFKLAWNVIKESRWYIFISALLMFSGAAIGYVYHEPFTLIINQVLEQLADAVEKIHQDDSVSNMFWTIFLNNTRAVIMFIFLGTFIFFMPALSMFSNGLLLGYIFQAGEMGELSNTAVFVYGILPHSIIELPVVIIAGGVGLFLGIRVLAWLFGPGKLFAHLFDTSSRRTSTDEFLRESWSVIKRRIIGVLVLLAIMILLLAVAALIESTITPWLINRYIIPMT